MIKANEGKAQKKSSIFNELTPNEKIGYVLAVLVAFAGTFVWFVKILFF